jgi:hypothetical protein
MGFQIVKKIALGLGILVLSPTGLAQLGDRLVVSINNLPYSQRQVEVYIAVKEALRVNTKGQVLVVQENNWKPALNAFSEDMIILQEAMRLGSFQVNDTMMAKYLDIVQSKSATDPRFAEVVARLGIDRKTLLRTLEDVLRVAGFRRSKKRQEDVASKDSDRVPSKGRQRWLRELEERAVSRVYQGAYGYRFINPTLGSSSDEDL